MEIKILLFALLIGGVLTFGYEEDSETSYEIKVNHADDGHERDFEGECGSEEDDIPLWCLILKKTTKPPTTTTTKEPTTKPPKTTTTTKEPTTKPPKTTTTTKEPTTKPPKTTTKPPKTTTKPPKTTTKPPKTTTKPPKTTTEPPTTTTKPPKTTTVPPKPTTQPTKPTTQPPKPTTQPPKPTTRPPKPTTQPTTTTPSPGVPTCSVNQQELYPHDKCCNLFYHCANGIPYLKECPSKLHYDPTLKICNYPDAVNCQLATQYCPYPPVARRDQAGSRRWRSLGRMGRPWPAV